MNSHFTFFGSQILAQAIPFPGQGGPSDNVIGGLIQGASVGLGITVFILFLIAMVKMFLHLAPPSEALIFSGLKRKAADGQMKSYRIVIGGRGFRIPFFEKVDRLSLGLMEIPISIRGAYSKGGIALNVDAIANIKISSDPNILMNAIERFLGRDTNEVRRVAKETLEGHVRGVLATLTPEEVNEDRLAFAEALSNESEEDLRKLGLHVDTVKIQHVTDDVHYLDSTGRSAIAAVIRDAEINESNFKRQAQLIESENKGRAEVAKQNADANIARMHNELRKIQAEINSRVRSEEERTEAAAREARATAEQELQKIRAELANYQQMVDVVLPAEAARSAEQFKARGDAAYLRERGRAVGESLSIVQQAWNDAGPTAIQIALIEDLDKILSTATGALGNVNMREVQVVDSGDGKAIQAYLNSYYGSLESIFKTVQSTTGIDVLGQISGHPSSNSLPAAPTSTPAVSESTEDSK